MRHWTPPLQPISRLATAAPRVVLLGAAGAALALVLSRGDAVNPVGALIILGVGLAVAAFGMLLSLAAFVVIWRQGLRGFGAAALGLVLGAALLGYPLTLAALGAREPMLHDVTTNPADPPRFSALARIRPAGANAVDYAPQSAEAQRKAYPEIVPLESAASVQDAYNAVLDAVSKRGWTIVEARPPQQRRPEAAIEAIARTRLMGFRDDVVVRIRPHNDGSVVDVRSASRFGSFDFGTNAARLRSLLDELDDELENPPQTAR